MRVSNSDPGGLAERVSLRAARAVSAIAIILAVSVTGGTQAPSQAGNKPPASPATDLAAVLVRAADAAAAYGEQAANVVADERCGQREFEVIMQELPTPGGMVTQARDTTRVKREWKAELVLVLTPDLVPSGYPWLELRDVVEVDRAPVPNRQARIETLLHDAEWLAKGRQMHEASSRFNIGPGPRTFNTPSIPMLVLHQANQSRFAFKKAGEEKVDGIRTWKIEFDERQSPTLMRASETVDVPAKGVLWVDPGTGELVRAIFRCQVRNIRSELTVTYRRQPGHAMRLPFEMLEKVATERSGYGVEGKYSYRSFRAMETSGRGSSPKHVERPGT